MTEQEALEAAWTQHTKDKVAPCETWEPLRREFEAGFRDALAWLRSQGEPVGYTTQLAIKFGNFTSSTQNLWGDKGVPLFLDPQPAIPGGWQQVPKEPTPEMVKAMQDTFWTGKSTYSLRTTDAYRVFFAMLAAAPGPSK